MWPFSQISRIACERPLVIDREGFMMVPHTHKEFIFNHPSIIRNINTISRYCYLSTDFVATNDSILFAFLWGGGIPCPHEKILLEVVHFDPLTQILS